MSTLRSKIIHLAHQKPEFRSHLLPLLKTANKPILEPLGLNATTVKSGLGAMLYFIDAASNHSKFYEMLVVQESNTVVLHRRWGALTDTGDTGRVDKKDEFFPTLGQAQAAMAKIYREKVGKGYRDAFNRKMHVSPTNERPLPIGQYPVGLTRNVGFGWGTQSATRCIPGLRVLQEKVDEAREDIDRADLAELLMDITAANTLVDQLMRNPEAVDVETNRSMGDILAGKLGPMVRRIRALQGELIPRIKPDLDKLKGELTWVSNYLQGQLSYCKVASMYLAKEKYPWDKCIEDQMEEYGDKETAEKVCGTIRAKSQFGKKAARSLHEIASEIYRLWKPVNFAAKPYLEAMMSLDSINDDYGADSGRSIVSYFLVNASGFRGPDAKRIKAELKALLK